MPVIPLRPCLCVDDTAPLPPSAGTHVFGTPELVSSISSYLGKKDLISLSCTSPMGLETAATYLWSRVRRGVEGNLFSLPVNLGHLNIYFKAVRIIEIGGSIHPKHLEPSKYQQLYPNVRSVIFKCVINLESNPIQIDCSIDRDHSGWRGLSLGFDDVPPQGLILSHEAFGLYGAEPKMYLKSLRCGKEGQVTNQVTGKFSSPSNSTWIFNHSTLNPNFYRKLKTLILNAGPIDPTWLEKLARRLPALEKLEVLLSVPTGATLTRLQTSLSTSCPNLTHYAEFTLSHRHRSSLRHIRQHAVSHPNLRTISAAFDLAHHFPNGTTLTQNYPTLTTALSEPLGAFPGVPHPLSTVYLYLPAVPTHDHASVALLLMEHLDDWTDVRFVALPGADAVGIAVWGRGVSMARELILGSYTVPKGWAQLKHIEVEPGEGEGEKEEVIPRSQGFEEVAEVEEEMEKPPSSSAPKMEKVGLEDETVVVPEVGGSAVKGYWRGC